MNTKNTISHVVYECKYHVIILPKYRYKVLTREIKIFVREEIRKLCLWLGVRIIEGNIGRDHIHLCLLVPPKYSIAEVIGTIKGKTAIKAFNKFPEMKKRYWGSHFWSRGYYVNTVGINEKIIREYIKNQDRIEHYEKQKTLFDM
jgi:putative transposase